MPGRRAEGHGHGGYRCDLQTMRMSRRHRQAAGEILPSARRSRSRLLVLPCLRHQRPGPLGAGPPGWLPVPDGRPSRPRRVARQYRRGTYRPLLDCRTVAAVLAVRPHPPAPDQPAALHPRRRAGPHSPARPPVPGRPRRRAPADNVHRDRQDHQPPWPAPVCCGDSAPAHHPVRGAQPRCPRRTAGVESGPAHRGHRIPPPAA
jgi:hypothetical protein